MSVPINDDEIRGLLDDEEEEDDEEEDEPSAGPSQQAKQVVAAVLGLVLLAAILVGLAGQNHWIDGKGVLSPGTRCVLASGRQAGVLGGRLRAVYAGQLLAVVLDPGPAGSDRDVTVRVLEPPGEGAVGTLRRSQLSRQ
jgi:hypothetical protein